MSVRSLLFGGKKRKRGSFVVLFLLLITPGLMYLDQWINKPTSVQISTTALASTTVAAPQYQNVSTAYFATQAPKAYRVQQTNPANGSTRVSVVAFGGGTDSAQIAFVSDLLPEGGLREVADYHLRTTDTADYTTLEAAYVPAGASAFQSTSASGTITYTIFLVHGSYYASITTSNGTPQELQTLLQQAVSAWKWIVS